MEEGVVRPGSWSCYLSGMYSQLNAGPGTQPIHLESGCPDVLSVGAFS